MAVAIPENTEVTLLSLQSRVDELTNTVKTLENMVDGHQDALFEWDKWYKFWNPFFYALWGYAKQYLHHVMSDTETNRRGRSTPPEDSRDEAILRIAEMHLS